MAEREDAKAKGGSRGCRDVGSSSGSGFKAIPLKPSADKAMLEAGMLISEPILRLSAGLVVVGNLVGTRLYIIKVKS